MDRRRFLTGLSAAAVTVAAPPIPAVAAPAATFTTDKIAAFVAACERTKLAALHDMLTTGTAMIRRRADYSVPGQVRYERVDPFDIYIDPEATRV